MLEVGAARRPPLQQQCARVGFGEGFSREQCGRASAAAAVTELRQGGINRQKNASISAEHMGAPDPMWAASAPPLACMLAPSIGNTHVCTA